MKKLWFVLLALLLLMVSCAPAPKVTPTPIPMPTPVPGILPAPLPPEKRGDVGLAGPAGPVGVEIERKVIRSATLNLAVTKVSEAAEAVTRLAGELGGFVVSSYRQGEKVGEIATVTIRVEAKHFDLALSRLRSLAVRVDSENTSGQDVTQEYVDLQAQLRNMEATEARYLALLERAQTVEEVLKVFQALSEVRGRIESLKGRLLYIERSSDLALISVYLRPATSPEPIVKKGWSAIETLKDALRRLSSFGQTLAGSLLWVGVWAPLWLPLLIALFFFGRWLRRRIT